MNRTMADFGGVRILVLGDVMLDRYIMGEVRRISPEAPVPVLRIKERYEVPGGAGNVGSNLARLGCEAILLGVVGEDAQGESLRGLCVHNGMRAVLVVDKRRPTITKTRIVAGDQQLLRLDDEQPDVLSDSVLTQLLESVEKNLAGCGAVVLSDYGKGIFQTPGFCQSVISLALKQGAPVFVDPKGKQWERYRNATCITPNANELAEVAEASVEGEARLAGEAEKVRQGCGADWLLVTRGGKGMCLVGGRDAPLVIPTIAREVYDVSGAGDTVIAVLAACVAGGSSFQEAARIANTAAGIVVGKLGTQPITAAELQYGLLMEKSGVNGVRYAGKSGTLESARMQAQAWRSNGEKIVFTNGCFDLLHPGHIHVLEEAKALGERLIVGLNSDASVKRLKGPRRPILAENDRVMLLKALACVDLVVIFEEDTPLRLIETLRPDILVKGSDYLPEQVVGREVVESYGGVVALVSLIDGYSTTRIAEKLAS
ncbi:MAG: bifunctional D-glycero-beta-D-manno-heptose-7-phosphate kinase/D-glycero-beta-D-manno-heptose 1-phosphate adenylyltransferase HldE [Syntrophobacteraceae bacterium]|nr:bifunctional D-glycero-beta-D-manno-heptose-7-phosphate kinase/D-glycero-beta-D-manno-heptose 1-phosphate adenylyltransferase HldE [Syntrophobacteraceae bacterium]